MKKLWMGRVLLRLSRIIITPPWELKAYKTPHSSVSGFEDFWVSCFSRLFIPPYFSLLCLQSRFFLFFHMMNCQGQVTQTA
jgi:hypothetical protein